jgi:hypothetical protein
MEHSNKVSKFYVTICVKTFSAPKFFPRAQNFAEMGICVSQSYLKDLWETCRTCGQVEGTGWREGGAGRRDPGQAAAAGQVGHQGRPGPSGRLSRYPASLAPNEHGIILNSCVPNS